MDDDLNELEAELKRLHPVPPSRRLRDRVGRDLAPVVAPRRSAPLRWLWAALLPAAAAAVITLVWSLRRPLEVPAVALLAPYENVTEPSLKPVTAENVLVSARDEGLVTLADGTAARRERLEFVDTITWKNPRTNSSLRWSVPREEVRIVPVVFQ